ncbi:hypothetical protein [Halarcobacter ebronensis]|uniref:Uncharacterized protein n=1 Tax=Halarcobacter ebronensis TaxID=1462615 RepID=A0A4Q1AQD8_9BACT|nr:hypothetical protein [Halarcobacter ebronensis]QKF81715.1 hypothetical protein AEBR_1221 [Halarcobacter ebronensis]RXK04607.1 hypothetical protein CRV07_10655 [Halarcobacter ebronensis]
MKKFICLIFVFLNINIYAYSELYESDLYYLDNNEVLLYKILNWWSNKSHENSTEFCFNNIKVRSNKPLILEYDKKFKKLKVYLKEDFADLISIFENKSVYLKNEYINKNYFKSLKAEAIQKVNSIIFKNISLSEYEKINKSQKILAFELEGKVAGLLAHSGKLSFHTSGEFLCPCPLKPDERFDIVFKLLNIKTKEVLVKYLLKD